MGSVPGAEQPSASLLRRSPPSPAAARGDPPSSGTCALPSTSRPATPRVLPPLRQNCVAQDLPCARTRPSRFPFSLCPLPAVSWALRGSDPPSPKEGEGEDRAGRTETKGQAGVGAARGHCVSECVCVCPCVRESVCARVCNVVSVSESAWGGPVPRGRSAGDRGSAPGWGRVSLSPSAAEAAGGTARLAARRAH